MEIGISLTPNENAGTDAHEAVRYLAWTAKYADEHGFDIIWSTEHHFTGVAFSSSPSVILSHYAALTHRAKLGYAVAILPMHHPVRLAEDISWVDNFSGGRLIAGVSPGWAAYEFSVLGIPIEERRERFLEGVEILFKALKGGKYSHEGKFWNIPESQIMPPPLQPGGPKFVTATTSDEGLVMAAKYRMSPLVGFDPIDVLIEKRNYYIAALKEDGAAPEEIADLLTRFGALRRVLVCDTDEEAEEEALVAAGGFSTNSSRLRVSAVTGQPIEGIVRRQMETAADPRDTHAFKGSVWGSPETVVKKLLALKEAGLGHVVCQFHGTTRNTEGVKDNVRMFATKVLPVYKEAIAKEPVGS